jgi:c-di-GMP-binding flagellar brake protein YcgR
VCVLLPHLVEKNQTYGVTIYFTRRDFLEADATVVGCQYDEKEKKWRANMQFQNMVPQDRRLLTQKLFKLEVSGKGHIAK